MSRLQAFPPVADAAAHTLILGSMPGVASLAAAQYYAHPRNLFWPLVGELLGIPPESTYAQRVAQLRARGFALWDVLGACRRPGSLDANIDADSLEINDFAAFLAEHPKIDRIFFNGAFAEQVFRRRVVPTLDVHAPLSLIRLPSTSPANASVPIQRKRAAWAALIR